MRKLVLGVALALLSGTAGAQWTNSSEDAGNVSASLVKSYSDTAVTNIGKTCAATSYSLSYNPSLIAKDGQLTLDTMLGLLLDTYSKSGDRIDFYYYSKERKLVQLHFVDGRGYGAFITLTISELSAGNSLVRQACVTAP